MEYTEQNPLRLVELFAGIGSQTQALKNIGVPHKVVGISEIDKYAIKSYEAMHGSANNLGDIREIKSLPPADLWTYSFPCQDISVAGRGAGIREGRAAVYCSRWSGYLIPPPKREHCPNTCSSKT